MILIRKHSLKFLLAVMLPILSCNKEPFRNLKKSSPVAIPPKTELLTEKLVTPNPSPEADRLFQFLRSNYGQKIISAATLTVGGNTEVDHLKQLTGKEPAMISIDFMHNGRGWTWWDDTWAVRAAKEYWDKNGIPVMMWHWRDPSRVTDEFYSNATGFDYSKISDPNSPEYTAIMSDIDYVAGQLKILQDQNIPVIWRPIHEAANQAFWWGTKGGAPYKILWQLMFDRMVNHHGLNNLIWVYTTEPSDSEWYPGDEYVDIVGRDMYKQGDHSSQVEEYNRINKLYSGKKMVAYTEAGSLPDPDNLIKDSASWSWFQIWSGDYTTGTTWNSDELWNKTMNSTYVITLDEMPSLKN